MPLGVLAKVFRHPAYVLLVLVVGSVTFAFAAWLPNLSLIAKHIEDPLVCRS